MLLVPAGVVTEEPRERRMSTRAELFEHQVTQIEQIPEAAIRLRPPAAEYDLRATRAVIDCERLRDEAACRMADHMSHTHVLRVEHLERRLRNQCNTLIRGLRTAADTGMIERDHPEAVCEKFRHRPPERCVSTETCDAHNRIAAPERLVIDT
ncbi:hypothetical protein KCU90_g810, partial [Aureobasidium melanogenum]